MGGVKGYYWAFWFKQCAASLNTCYLHCLIEEYVDSQHLKVERKNVVYS